MEIEMKNAISYMFIFVIIFVLGVITWGASRSYENSNIGNDIALKINCKFIGLVHANHNIGYFECGDSIVIKRVNE